MSAMLMASLLGCQSGPADPTVLRTWFYLPGGARNIQGTERQSWRSISYQIDVPYPAESFLCELTHDPYQKGWRGLRESARNPGLASSLVDGWGDYQNASRQTKTHVHAWSADWLSMDGDVVSYGLTYEYPEDGQPDFSTLTVVGAFVPAEMFRAQFVPRAERLPLLVVPSVLPAAVQFGEPMDGSDCAPLQWSEFVKTTVSGASPVRALPSELARVRSILIGSDIDGLADRIAAALKVQAPELVVSVPGRSSGDVDATLDFNFACRCNQKGAPNGFYVREAVLHKRAGAQREWSEPARVLYYWSDAGTPAWRSQVPASCIGQTPLGASCRTAFEQADVAFASDLGITWSSLQPGGSVSP